MEAENQDMACMPLFEAEMDRDELRSTKHLIESKYSLVYRVGFIFKNRTRAVEVNSDSVRVVVHGYMSSPR